MRCPRERGRAIGLGGVHIDPLTNQPSNRLWISLPDGLNQAKVARKTRKSEQDEDAGAHAASPIRPQDIAVCPCYRRSYRRAHLPYPADSGRGCSAASPSDSGGGARL